MCAWESAADVCAWRRKLSEERRYGGERETGENECEEKPKRNRGENEKRENIKKREIA